MLLASIFSIYLCQGYFLYSRTNIFRNFANTRLASSRIIHSHGLNKMGYLTIQLLIIG
jgi:hypothetical protein